MEVISRHDDLCRRELSLLRLNHPNTLIDLLITVFKQVAPPSVLYQADQIPLSDLLMLHLSVAFDLEKLGHLLKLLLLKAALFKTILERLRPRQDGLFGQHKDDDNAVAAKLEWQSCISCLNSGKK